MRRLLAASLCLACVTSRAARRGPTPPVRAGDSAPARCADPLQRFAAGLLGADGRVRARAIGLSLADARGATNLAGELEADDVVMTSRVVAELGPLGALLVTTRCGNATLLALRCEGGWRARGRAALVEGARPGACGATAARAEAVALWGAPRSEILAAWSSEREDGDSERATTFSAFRLRPDGALQDLTGPVPFGGEDDASGAGVEGRWFVDEVLPPPRDVVLELRPSHPGVDGVALTRIERQVWRPGAGRLVRVALESERILGRGAGR